MGKRSVVLGRHGLHSTGVTAFYSERRSADHGNETRTDSSESCEPTAEERGAGNPHATFCGSRGRATASGDPVGWETGRCRMAQATAPILDLYEGAAVKEYFGGLAILIAPGYGFRRAVKSRSREAVRRRRRT